MAIPWAIIAEGVAKAYQAYQEREKAKNDRDKAEQSIKKVINAIEQAKREIINEIVDEIRNTRLHDLEGDAGGIITNFSDYRIYNKISDEDKWRFEETRLSRMIDNAAGVVEDFKAILNSTNFDNESQLNFAVKIYPIYVDIVFIRAVAMIERHYTYGMDDESRVQPMIEDLKKHTNNMYAALRKRSDARFSSMRSRQDAEGFSTIYYWDFNGTRKNCGVLNSSDTFNEDVDHCHKNYLSHKNEEFNKYPGVQPVLKTKELLGA
uniref:hypothetical protein n=1 Tax=Candidatus Electronema sp. TaxID=2698783 RepID=UPI0040571B54